MKTKFKHTLVAFARRIFLICVVTSTFVLKAQNEVDYPTLTIEPEIDSTRHFISMNLVQFRFPTFAMSYEYIFARGHLGIRIPVAKGVSNGEDENYNKSAKYSYGADLNIYFGKGNFSGGTAKFFMAPSIEYGAFNYIHIDRTLLYSYTSPGVAGFGPGPTTTHYIETKNSHTGYQYTTMLKFGWLIRPMKYLNISVVGGIGAIKFNSQYRLHGAPNSEYFIDLGTSKSNNSHHENAMITKLEINIGYKF